MGEVGIGFGYVWGCPKICPMVEWLKDITKETAVHYTMMQIRNYQCGRALFCPHPVEGSDNSFGLRIRSIAEWHIITRFSAPPLWYNERWVRWNSGWNCRWIPSLLSHRITWWKAPVATWGWLITRRSTGYLCALYPVTDRFWRKDLVISSIGIGIFMTSSQNRIWRKWQCHQRRHKVDSGLVRM